MPAITAMLNLLLAWLTGAALAMAWFRKQNASWSLEKQSPLRRTIPWTLFAAAMAQCMLLWLETALMSELPLSQAAARMPMVMRSTHYGLGWMLGSAALLVAATAARRRWPALLGCAIAVFMFSRAMLGHAAADGDLSWTMLVDLLHLACASAWTGLVLVAAWMLLSAKDSVAAPASFFPALSRAATVALSGVVLSGILNAWRHLSGAPFTFASPYTMLLAAKVAMVACAAALGAWNRFFVMPALGSGLAGRWRFSVILRWEALILTVVLVLAAMLSASPPPGSAD